MVKTNRCFGELGPRARYNIRRELRNQANAAIAAARAPENDGRNERVGDDREVNREVLVNVPGEAEVENRAGREGGQVEPERPVSPPGQENDDEDGGGEDREENGMNVENNNDDNGGDHDDDDDDEDNVNYGRQDEHERRAEANLPLYDNAAITYGESMAMVLGLMLQHNLTGSCISDILEVLKYHCPAQGLQRLSYYKFRRFTSCDEVKKNKKFYCSYCVTGLENEGALCTVCRVERDKSYFVQLPIEPQLAEMYKRTSFYNSLQHRHLRQRAGPDSIEDIYDGSIYKALMVPGGFLTNQHNISLTWYTDGIPVFKSKNYSIWPFVFLINELPYKMRSRRENIVMPGLWFGPHKPSANMFMRSFLPDLRRIYTIGMNIRIHDLNNEFKCVKAIVIAGVCDTPVKSNFLNIAAHSGFYGCPVCEIQGESVWIREDGQRARVGGEEEVQAGQGNERPKDKRHHSFPYQERLTLRTTASFENYARQALELVNQRDTGVNGVKGPTALHVFMPDFLKGTAIDPMHLITGVVKKLMRLHFSSMGNGQPYSLRDFIKALDTKLKKIKPPKFIHRRPQSLEEFERWKASQLMCWLLHYSIPIYKNVLAMEYFQHWLKLVAAISLLSADIVSTQNILRAERLLKEFVREFEALYHLKYCSINIHLLLHLADCVRHLGPLWVYTCFPMESMNGEIVGNIHGKTSVDGQVCNSFWQIICKHQYLSSIRNPEIKNFVMGRKRSVKITDQINPGCYSVGDYKRIGAEDRAIEVLLEAAHINTQNTLFYFRLLKDSMIYACERYERDLASDSSYVAYHRDGNKYFGCVQVFIRVSACHCYAQCECITGHFAIIKSVKCVESFRLPYHNNFVLPRIHRYKYNERPRECIVPVSSLKTVCVCVNIDDDLYLSEPPNSYEVE